MIGVRLLFVAAIIFCHYTNCAKDPPPAAADQNVVQNRKRQRNADIHSQPTKKQLVERNIAVDTSSASASQNIVHINSAFNSWRIWKYECNDMRELSIDTWSNYIEPTKTVLLEGPKLLDALLASEDIIWPAQMGQKINLNKHKQVGTAIFREGIQPDYMDTFLLNPKGGYFTLTVLTKVGTQRSDEMHRLKQLFTSLLQYFFGTNKGDGKTTVPEVRAAVCGIFARAEANYDDNTAELPAKFRFQVWLRDWDGKKEMVEAHLKKWTDARRKGFGFGNLEFFAKSDVYVRG